MWDGRLVHYDSTDMTQLSLAYAITVHRSQGSEIPCVVLALHDSHYTLLERQLLYTAVTRAKKLLIVVGSKRALAIASKKASTKQRLSKLVDRIRKGLS
jgi:exodeoxyribonuclease V alpha subunit